jgi:hypothetical protein
MIHDEDRLERLLREDARSPLADDGFTLRVMGALPVAAGAAPRAWLKPALVLGSAALGSLLATLFAPAGVSVTQGFLDLVQWRGLTPAATAGLALAGAMLVSAIVLAADSD